MLHLKTKRDKAVFILRPMLIYHDKYINCCFDVATLVWQLKVFFFPLSHHICYKRDGTERISHNANHSLTVSKARLSRLSQGKGPQNSTLICSGFINLRRLHLLWLLDNLGPTRFP